MGVLSHADERCSKRRWHGRDAEQLRARLDKQKGALAKPARLGVKVGPPEGDRLMDFRAEDALGQQREHALRSKVGVSDRELAEKERGRPSPCVGT